MEEIINSFMSTLLPTIITMMSGLVSWGLVEITKYIRLRTKSEAVNDAVSHICHTVKTTVKEIAQTTAKEFMKNGKLTTDGKVALKLLTINKIKEQIPNAFIKTASGAVNSVNDLIEAKIEKAVLELKAKK